MTIHTRPDDQIFAAAAEPGELDSFPDLARGWGVTLDTTKGIPPMEYFNALQQRTDKAIAYLLQRGVAEWSKDIEYPQQAITIKNGQVFFAKQQNTNKDPYTNPEIWVNSFAQKANQADFDKLKNAMIGIPLPYPLETVPENHLAMNGQRFNKSTYPELAKKYPSGQLPDMRGEFIRGWDNGRGVDKDKGRAILSWQDECVLAEKWGGDINEHNLSPSDAIAKWLTSGTYKEWQTTGRIDTYIAFPKIGDENLVRNIAWNYICLAR